MRILQFGRIGQVGQELLAQAPAHDVVLETVERDDLDLTDAAALERFLDRAAPFDALVNAAAYTAVDRAESESGLAHALNAEAPRLMAKACAARGVPLLHISTDYVFDGTRTGAYRETDRANPQSVYGWTKLAGEEAVLGAHDRNVVLRTAWVFSRGGQNFVRTMLRLAREREVLRVVDDQRGCPTPACDIADALLRVAVRITRGAESGPQGVFHFCGDTACTWADFAEATLEEGARHGITARVERIPTTDYPTPAKRPANSVLDCSRITSVHGIAPAPWRSRLPDHVDALVKSL
ncbi:MAG: dTDP-4-dehydrorhamnose reductase [Alphaproteobacteria bacterium]|nr:dTDP-4-dehydrorhamnose reductase [Alphaproteobacteria bacterium]